MRIEVTASTGSPPPEGLQQVTLNPLSSGKAQRHGPSKRIAVETNTETVRHEDTFRTEEITRIKKLTKENPSVLYDTRNENGESTLHMAIWLNCRKAAMYLISKVPHPSMLNNRDCRGHTPLYVAVSTRQAIIARRLILAGADPTIPNFQGNSALHVACLENDITCVAALINPLDSSEEKFVPAGKTFVLRRNFEQRNYTDGQSCLHIAALQGHADIARLLLKSGANPSAREYLEGRTPLHLAIRKNCQSVISILLKEGNYSLNTPTYGGLTVYQLALRMGNYRLADELVKHGAKAEPLEDSDSESDLPGNKASNISTCRSSPITRP